MTHFLPPGLELVLAVVGALCLSFSALTLVCCLVWARRQERRDEAWDSLHWPVH